MMGYGLDLELRAKQLTNARQPVEAALANLIVKATDAGVEVLADPQFSSAKLRPQSRTRACEKHHAVCVLAEEGTSTRAGDRFDDG